LAPIKNKSQVAPYKTTNSYVLKRSIRLRFGEYGVKINPASATFFKITRAGFSNQQRSSAYAAWVGVASVDSAAS